MRVALPPEINSSISASRRSDPPEMPGGLSLENRSEVAGTAIGHQFGRMFLTKEPRDIIRLNPVSGSASTEMSRVGSPFTTKISA